MKNKITKIALAIMVITNMVLFVAPVNAETDDIASLVIPVRFQYNVDTESLEEGNAIPLEVTQDVFQNGKKLFNQGGSGFAVIDELKKARSFGRGGKIKITQGQLIDINGKTHQILLSSNAKGNYKVSSPAGVLIGASTAYNIAEAAFTAGSVTGSIFGVGVLLIPVAFFFKKGQEAKLAKGKIMFARIR